MEIVSANKEDKKVNIAYIDAANLDQALRSLGWKLDYKRFRIWLKEKYKVERAYIFIGRIKKYKNLYAYFEESNFFLVYKEVLYQKGKTKGNCDSDLLMYVVKDFYEGDLNRAVLVASDGDYAPLVRFLKERNQIEVVLSPAPAKRCSVLLKRTNAPIAYLNNQRSLLELAIETFNEKAPDTDETV
ncbi:MAG: hypothetical protein JWM92_497 [Candidatus Nomurabacteria bacterium]|jgi:hypothetical protein|nr:hypothetical protein [Candidatus Nomurabacteria bacterium]